MRLADAVNIQKSRADQSTRPWSSRWRTLADQINIDPALFFRFTKRGLLWIFIKFNMPPKRQPFIELLVMNDQNSRLLNDKDCDREIDFFVDVGHKERV